MRTELCDEAVDYGTTAQRAIESAGGHTLVERAEATPAERMSLWEGLLGDLGAWDLDIRGDQTELEAAAALCRAAGWHGLNYPLAERLARRGHDTGLVVVSGAFPQGWIDAVDVASDVWTAVDLEGRVGRITATSAVASPRYGGYVANLDIDWNGAADPSVALADASLAMVLSSWTLLGMLDRAVALACQYVGEREQFGQTLASFQGVQFQLTEAEVERLGLEQLAKYALWSLAQGPGHPLDEALALRLAALDAAEIVFRVTHQVHGAIGFCDETVLSWISRASQPIRTLPIGPAQTASRAADGFGEHGFGGLFDRNELVEWLS